MRDSGSSRPGDHAVVVEHALRGYPPDTERRFLGDPEAWLPRPLTMHGAKTFQARMRLLGAALTLDLQVGTPWTRGTTSTRRFRVTFVDPPFLVTWMLPTVDGELVLLPTAEQGIALRFEGAPKARGILRGRGLLAPLAMRRIMGGIVARLEADAPPTPPSRA